MRIELIGGRDVPEKRHSCRCANPEGKTVEVVIIEPDNITAEYDEYRRRVGFASEAVEQRPESKNVGS